MRLLLLTSFTALLLSLSGASARQAAPAAPPQAPDFARDVLPILESNCLRCHNAAKQEAGFVMDAFDDLMRGGDSGETPIVPGDAHGSPLIGQVEGRAKPKMPPKKDLPADEIAVLRAWIDAGARYSEPRRVSIDGRVPDIVQRAALRPQVTSLAFRPDGGALAVAGYKEVRRFALPGLGPLPPLAGMSDLVRAVAWSPDGTRVAVGGGTPGLAGELVLFDAASGERLHTLPGHRDYVYHVAFSADGTRLASCGYDRLVRVWDAATGKPVSVLREHTEAVYAVAFSPDGRWLASAAADRSVKIWDVESGARLYTLSEPAEAVTTVAFDPGGQYLAAGGADKSIRVWEVSETGGKQVRVTLAHTGGVLRLAYSPDGAWLASSASDRQVKIWDAATGDEVRGLGAQSDWAQALAWSPDGRLLAVGRYDGSVTLYDIASGRQVLEPIPGTPVADRPEAATR